MRIYDMPIDILKLDEETEQYSDLLHLHAAVNRASETERFSGGSERDTLTMTFDVRWCAAVKDISYNTTDYRIRYNGMLFNAVAADDYMENHRVLRITGIRI